MNAELLEALSNIVEPFNYLQYLDFCKLRGRTPLPINTFCLEVGKITTAKTLFPNDDLATAIDNTFSGSFLLQYVPAVKSCCGGGAVR